MTLLTGLLPIREGAACLRFPGNLYPSLSGLFESSALISPGAPEVWNQKRMCDAYGIDSAIFKFGGSDEWVMSTMCDILDNYDFVLAKTIASHLPFTVREGYPVVNFPEEMPVNMRHYLNCVRYTDSTLEEFLKRIDTDERLKNSIVIITGDHSIFSKEEGKEFERYCTEHGENYSVTERYSPLIIYSPEIKENTVIDEECLQMDIYPTVLHLIGCDSTYWWKGFGKDLLDPDSSRPFTEEEAYILSDKLILSDYFRSLNN